MVKLKNQWQILNLLVLTIPKLSLKVEFGKDLAEIQEVFHNSSHQKKFQLLNQLRSCNYDLSYEINHHSQNLIKFCM